MLPFQKKQEASVVMPSESIRRTPDHEEEYDHVEAAAEDLYHAVKSGHIKGIAEALRAAFDILDSEPHHEGPHIGENE
jgi:hypothetical protein